MAIEGLHAFHFALLHRVHQRLAFRLAAFDVFLRARRCFQNLYRGHATATIRARHQPLRDEVTERLRQPVANYLLFVLRKNADDPFDRFGRIDCMQRREHQMAGFGSFQRDFHRLAIAHLADQDHLRRLSQRGAQSQRKVRRVRMQFALMNG